MILAGFSRKERQEGKARKEGLYAQKNYKVCCAATAQHIFSSLSFRRRRNLF
jgi:hypothetical protein